MISQVQYISQLLKDIFAVAFKEKGFFKQGYELEISSPGVDRALSKASHFENVLGKSISIKTVHGYGLPNEVRGVLRTINNNGVELESETDESKNIFIVFKAMVFAKVIWQFKKLSKKKRLQGRTSNGHGSS